VAAPGRRHCGGAARWRRRNAPSSRRAISRSQAPGPSGHPAIRPSGPLALQRASDSRRRGMKEAARLSPGSRVSFHRHGGSPMRSGIGLKGFRSRRSRAVVAESAPLLRPGGCRPPQAAQQVGAEFIGERKRASGSHESQQRSRRPAALPFTDGQAQARVRISTALNVRAFRRRRRRRRRPLPSSRTDRSQWTALAILRP
jgi:hypothetical protein